MIISSPPPFHTAPSPSPNEFEDLSTFLRCRHRKKLEEKRERMQPRITNFFLKIKKEPDYDGDDERTSPAAAFHTPISSPKGRKSPTAKGNMGKRSPKTVQSPGLLNNLAVHMPPGTFIPISVTFASIAASQQDASKVSKNLIGTFDEVSTKSEIPVSPSQKVIQPTESTSEAVHISPSSLTGADDYDLVMVNCETQTNIIEMQSCGLQTKSCEVQSTSSQTEGKEVFNRETNMSPSMTETIETQTDLKFSTSQMQTEPDVHTAETQPEITVQSSEVQTEVDVIMSETQTEVELAAAETQTEWDVNTSQTQTESTVQTADVQTEPPDDKIVQTEVNNSNILTVNRIEVVSEMLSWGTQTDLEELALMTPIYPSNDDDTDSILSSPSKHHEHDDVASKSAIKPAGLDMCRGEYRDVDFPPVSTLHVPMKPLMEHAIQKERTPSPVDLCTTPKSPVKKKFKSAEKLPAACTVSEDPRDVLRYVHKSSKESLKIAPAHQPPPPSPSVTSKPRDMTKSLIEEEAWKSASITKDDTSMLFRR